ncbi:MarR family transcriptional regulator (plasmid) [Aminobacter sp. SR38]|jgi:DNA-binding MarR family transcriptional regulator|uniref:MarR family winged helix-turn-helix transcriptional regulator n=1 Tax=Aminobacter sp. SR38 TaxID=2774562 RepID=UPI001784448A|nr:MarR family transcriptional regulator [Aminobacter sp. SR38]QOF75580.1 MarR family transcriptional regulator [Aminobacter sp. SR38]
MAKMRRDGTNIPNIGEGRRGLEGYLLYLLRQASTAAQQAVDRTLADLGLSLAQYSALTMINSYTDLSSADLARLSMLTPQSAHEVVQRLDTRGLVSKTLSRENKRIHRLQLTDDGRSLLTEARERSERVEMVLREEAASINEAELRKWLVAVAGRLELEGRH